MISKYEQVFEMFGVKVLRNYNNGRFYYQRGDSAPRRFKVWL